MYQRSKKKEITSDVKLETHTHYADGTNQINRIIGSLLSVGNQYVYLYWDGTNLVYSGQLNTPIGILGQFDPRIRWTCISDQDWRINSTIRCNFNTSNEPNDAYLYGVGTGIFMNNLYNLWRFRFNKGIWEVVNCNIIYDDESRSYARGIVRLGNYVYILVACTNANPIWFYRANLNLTNITPMTISNLPRNVEFNQHNGIATDGTYIYAIGEDYSGLYNSVHIYKFSVSETTLTYISRFGIYQEGTGDYIRDLNLACDGTYLYVDLTPNDDFLNKRIRRYTLNGSFYTDFNYMLSSYPYCNDGLKRNICLGLFRISNRWYAVEFYFMNFMRAYYSIPYTAFQPCFYLKPLTF